MKDISGQTALVTGAGTGIGRGISLGLAKAGADVAVNYPPIDGEASNAEDVVSEIVNNGGTAITVEADVSDEADVRQMVKEVTQNFGTPDILVNNAGILEPCELSEMSVETWDRTMDVDLRGVFLPTRFFLPDMLERGSGKIVNIASQLAFIGREEMVHYSAAKGGVISFTRALAHEVSPEINVNAIAPGPIDTGIVDVEEEAQQEMIDDIPMKRIGDVDDVVPTAVFLAGEGGDYYTGQTLSPDGGDAMH